MIIHSTIFILIVSKSANPKCTILSEYTNYWFTISLVNSIDLSLGVLVITYIPVSISKQMNIIEIIFRDDEFKKEA